ncbi:hypothetical protein K0M31_007323 [Melipona bicolor]|uniref:Uncharacterized protein n=1 Tax=Melipona bicolor TaxID=60889 RepID=A0AA40GCK7_9HYME|nr:hypothetical protein K0M31_007323 [Melipona bicolor]
MIIPPALCAETSPGPPNKLAPRYLSEASVSWYVCIVVWRSLHARHREPQVVRTNPFSSFVGLLANKEFPRSPIRSRESPTSTAKALGLGQFHDDRRVFRLPPTTDPDNSWPISGDRFDPRTCYSARKRAVPRALSLIGSYRLAGMARSHVPRPVLISTDLWSAVPTATLRAVHDRTANGVRWE